MFTSQNKLSNAFRFKYHVPKKIKSGVVYKIQCGLCNKQYYGECIRHLNIRIGEYITIFSLTKKKNKSKASTVSVHLLLSNHSQSFESLIVRTR